MEPILSKQEIADLLRSIQDDNTTAPRPSALVARKTQTSHRSFDLFETAPAGQDLQPLDNFDFIVDSFGGRFSSLLSRYLQRSVAVKSSKFSSASLKTHLLTAQSHSTTSIVEISPIMVPAIVNYDANLCSIFLEFMMGGSGSQIARSTVRPRTRLELHILGSLVNLVCEALDHAFKPIGEIKSSLISTISEAELGSYIDPEAEVCVYSSEIQIDSLSGHVDLVFPAGAFEPFRDSLRRLNLLNGLGGKRWSRSIENSLGSMTVTVMAQTETVDLSVGQLINLQPGDIIGMDHEPGSRLDLLVEGVAKFSGSMLVENHRRTVRINEIYS